MRRDPPRDPLLKPARLGLINLLVTLPGCLIAGLLGLAAANWLVG